MTTIHCKSCRAAGKNKYGTSKGCAAHTAAPKRLPVQSNTSSTRSQYYHTDWIYTPKRNGIDRVLDDLDKPEVEQYHYRISWSTK